MPRLSAIPTVAVELRVTPSGVHYTGFSNLLLDFPDEIQTEIARRQSTSSKALLLLQVIINKQSKFLIRHGIIEMKLNIDMV
jgi:hypothetical protein